MSEARSKPVEHVWLSEAFSVPKSTLCWHAPPSPNADFRCCKIAGHAGRHEHRMATGLDVGVETRSYSHREAKP